ncbi:PREDICTED: 21 kDa protein-like [Populus euphratica]|uniref:21 kDa protein-like n=1 Tax=Populus euphratica TaxID=75702 RepID=A0AAJ6XWP7_POPEU|nr:PREDICTED: 21 kDa protein-like [Populus euphratica]
MSSTQCLTYFLFLSILQPSTLMARLSLFILLLLLSLVCITGAEKPARFPRRSRSRAYIENACTKTLYPSLCIQYLSVSANSTTIRTPQQLAQAALSVSLYKALQTRTFMLKVVKGLKARKSKDYQAVKDCLDQIGNSVDQLTQSVRELHRLERTDAEGGDNVFWHISNVETFVSSAMTDASTCLDGFPGRNMDKSRAMIKAKVLNVAQTASNALALFHRYAAKYKP